MSEPKCTQCDATGLDGAKVFRCPRCGKCFACNHERTAAYWWRCGMRTFRVAANGRLIFHV